MINLALILGAITGSLLLLDWVGEALDRNMSRARREQWLADLRLRRAQSERERLAASDVTPITRSEYERRATSSDTDALLAGYAAEFCARAGTCNEPGCTSTHEGEVA